LRLKVNENAKYVMNCILFCHL